MPQLFVGESEECPGASSFTAQIVCVDQRMESESETSRQLNLAVAVNLGSFNLSEVSGRSGWNLGL
jgi:hypothetical protein